jgi:hypothetical protein
MTTDSRKAAMANPYDPTQQPYRSGYGQDPYTQRQPSTNGMAIASLITSIAGIVTAGLGFPVGAILGHVALSQIKRTGQEGRGLALAGIIIGWSVTALVLGVVVIGFIIGVIRALNTI